VLAAIDGTHIAIKAPSQYEEAFVNRKGVHTINVQAVVDPEMQLHLLPRRIEKRQCECDMAAVTEHSEHYDIIDDTL